MSTSELARLKVTVKHLLRVWPAVLERRHYLRSMAQSEKLRAALSQTYAGHVFNAMHATLSSDLVRAIGAFILDADKRSASVARAVAALRKRTVVETLRAQVYPSRVRNFQNMQWDEFDSLFAELPARLDEIDAATLKAPVAATIKDIRDKVVAHAAVEYDGSDWKMWAVGGTQLTYGQFDEYIDACTKAVDSLGHIVLRTAFIFDDLPGVHQRYVDEYIDALVTGLKHQKRAKERRRAENLKRTRPPIAKSSTRG
jgi:hypothetical protein